MVSRRKNLQPRRVDPKRAADIAANAGADADGHAEDERPLGHRRSGGASGFGPAIAGIMAGIDADIFRDPAAIRRMERDRTAVARTADGTVVGIGPPTDDAAEADGEGGKGGEPA